MKPLNRLVSESSEVHKNAVIQWELEADLREARISSLKSRLKKSLSKGGGASDILKELQAVREDKEPPVERRYVVNDTTVEKLGELLNENPNGLLVFRDELAG